VTSELETAFESYIRFLAPDLAAGMVAQLESAIMELTSNEMAGRCYQQPRPRANVE